MPHANIIAATRTPQAKLLGSLSHLTAPALGAHALRAIDEAMGWDNSAIDQVIMGQVVSAGCGQAPARQAATAAGIPTSVGAVTINKVCGSGLYSVMLADMAIRAGQYRRVIAGGMESMSQAPHLLSGGRSGWKFGAGNLLDALEVDGLRCANSGLAMGSIAEHVAGDFGISREDQDAWAVRSHQRAIDAQSWLAERREIAPVTIASKKQVIVLAQDEGPRADCSLQSLAQLRAVFPIEYQGTQVATVTAGNSSSLADGAAALAVVDDLSRELLRPAWAFRIVAHVNLASPHQQLFTAPAYAIQQLLRATGRTLSDIDLFEINEAFAAQVLACNQILGVDSEKVNIGGGAIALGHPLGCSGARILVTLIHALLRRNLSTGIAALCLGGGEAVAMLIERI